MRIGINENYNEFKKVKRDINNNNYYYLNKLVKNNNERNEKKKTLFKK